MKQLASVLKTAKNRLSDGSPWLMLLEITPYGEQTPLVRLVKNNDNIVFDGNTYSAFNFELDAIDETAKGELPQPMMRCSNVGRAVSAYVEQYGGLVDATCVFTWVHHANLDAGYSDLSLAFDVLAVNTSSMWVEFKLGPPNFLTRRLQDRYLASNCSWVFNSPAVRNGSSPGKGIECGYTGTDATCDRTLQGCRAKSNTPRFSGFPGLSSGGVKFAKGFSI